VIERRVMPAELTSKDVRVHAHSESVTSRPSPLDHRNVMLAPRAHVATAGAAQDGSSPMLCTQTDDEWKSQVKQRHEWRKRTSSLRRRKLYVKDNAPWTDNELSVQSIPR